MKRWHKLRASDESALVTYLEKGGVVPSLDVMAASSSGGGGAVQAFVIGLLGINNTRGEHGQLGQFHKVAKRSHFQKAASTLLC
jgi:hypothetical protein